VQMIAWKDSVSEMTYSMSSATYNTIQYNNVIYRALFMKRPGALTQLAVICSAK